MRENENGKVRVSSEVGRDEGWKMGACTSVSFAWTRFLSLGWGQGKGEQAAQGLRDEQAH